MNSTRDVRWEAARRKIASLKVIKVDNYLFWNRRIRDPSERISSTVEVFSKNFNISTRDILLTSKIRFIFEEDYSDMVSRRKL